MDIFSIMPIEAFMDDRLTKTDIRVLGAILSWRNKNTNICWPKREQISERTNLPLCKISTSTTNLESLGWLTKDGDGGKSKPTKYTLTIPEINYKTVTEPVTVTELVTVTEPVTQTVTEPVTVTELVTVTEPVTQTVTEPVTQTVTDLVRGNKHKDKHKEKQKTIVVTKIEKFLITQNWMPSDRCKELLARAGINEKFYTQLIDEFILYWEERHEARSGWDSTFLNHAKRQWQQPRFNQPSANFQPNQKPVRVYVPEDQRNQDFNAIDSTARTL